MAANKRLPVYPGLNRGRRKNMSTSKFYYYADFKDGASTVRSVPVLAIHAGDNDSQAWHSGDVTSGIEFKNVFERIHQQVPASLAIPQIFSMLVPTGREWERVSITAYEPKKGQRIMTGPSFYLTLRGVTVIQNVSINGRDVPSQPSIQNDELVRKFGSQSLSWVVDAGFSVSDNAEIGN